MNMNDHVEFDRLRERFSRNTNPEDVPLDYIYREARDGHINTEMDIQRQYVWTPAREQEMWDSLLLNVRIPEFHAILQGRIRYICDGKQRLTCILRILDNKIPYKIKTARPECQWLFTAAAKPNRLGKIKIPTEIYFKDLPQEFQDAIWTKKVHIIQYSGFGRKEEISLFKKINFGMSLSDFARGMASCFYMRKDFTGPLMSTVILDEVMNQSSINDEELETILIRALLLCANDNAINLQPNVLESYYSIYEDENLICKWQSEFFKLLQRFSNLTTAFKCRSKKTIMPFVFEGVYRHPELTTTQIDKLCNEIVSYHAGRGSDLGATRVAGNRKYIEDLIKKIKISTE